MNGPTHSRPALAAAQRENPAAAVYLEVAPLELHRRFVDHFYILRDNGTLTAAERRLFASPFREINFTIAHGHAPGGWKLVDLPPRFGGARRCRPFHGWILGIRCHPFAPLKQVGRIRAATEALSETWARNIGDNMPLDPLVFALDNYIDSLIGASEFPPAAATPVLAASLRELGSRAEVGATAEAAGVSARTLQRQVRTVTGLAPKRWLALLRFAKAARTVALAQVNLAEVAAAAGYADQAHMSAEFARHAATSPGRLRAQARRQRCGDAVRFLQDPALRSRLRLLIAEP